MDIMDILSEYLKTGCQWTIDGKKCKKKCVSEKIFYCQDHKDIPDIKRIIDEPLTATTCRKRNCYFLIK